MQIKTPQPEQKSIALYEAEHLLCARVMGQGEEQNKDNNIWLQSIN